jgi:hypothetical protein
VHAASQPNAGAFLILHAGRDHGTRQAGLLAAALRESGTPVECHGLGGASARAHVMLSRKFGAPGFPVTEIARTWLQTLFSARPVVGPHRVTASWGPSGTARRE